jgi:hypothetical protein
MAATFGVGSTEWTMHALLFSGRDPSSPPTINTKASSNAGNTSPVTVTATTLTASAGDDLVWVADMDAFHGTAAAFTPPTGYTEATDVHADFENASTAYQENVSAGATGSVAGTWTSAANQAGWMTWLIRLPIAPSGGGRGLFLTPPVNGLGGGGSFFRDPLAAPRT